MRIAISGKSGCGNSTVSRLVAARLGYRLVNYTFRSIAKEIGVSFEEMRELAEAEDKWDRYLDEKQVEMARDGNAVLGSRLAVWVLDNADLRIYLDAPTEVRARRIQRREGGTFQSVLAQTLERDRRDHQRYLRLYGIDNDDFTFVDAIIDVTDLTPEEIAEQIVGAAASLSRE